jgi:hypothetical protein
MTSQPLSIIADITVVTSAPQVAAPTFNTGLVTGTSTAIPSYGVNSRVRTYLASTFSSAMIADGFTTNSPEFVCAQMYFSQSPQPNQIQIGRQDTTAIATAIPHAGSAGTNYIVGDVIGVTQGGASFGFLRVSAVAAGVVTTLDVIPGSQGTAYSIASALATTGGSGTGLEVDITAIGETPLQAIQACRLSSAIWYPCMSTTAVDADHEAISAWVLTQVGTIYFGTSGEAAVQNGIANNLFTTLFNAGSKRTWMQWASTQSGLVPNQVYFVATVMGQVMASNTQLAGSAFTEKFSGGVPLAAVVVEPNLTQTQIFNIEGTSTSTGPNGNLYLNYAGSFPVLEQGTMMAPSVFLDQILNLDVLASNIQYSIMNLLTSVPKIPQTDAGQQQLIQAVETALAASANTGFIAPGIWNGQNIINKITPGQPLPLGYAVVSPKYSTLTTSQLTSRTAPPIYIALIEAGAVHFVVIEVLVQI